MLCIDKSKSAQHMCCITVKLRMIYQTERNCHDIDEFLKGGLICHTSQRQKSKKRIRDTYGKILIVHALKPILKRKLGKNI